MALFQRGASLIGTLLYGSLGIWAISAAGGGGGEPRAAGLALFGVWRLLCAMFRRAPGGRKPPNEGEGGLTRDVEVFGWGRRYERPLPVKADGGRSV